MSQPLGVVADINALVDAVGPLAAAKGFGLAYDAEPSAIAGP